MRPSDQVIDHGAVPVSSTVKFAEPPGQIVAEPFSTAFGGSAIVTVADPDPIELHQSSETQVTV